MWFAVVPAVLLAVALATLRPDVSGALGYLTPYAALALSPFVVAAGVVSVLVALTAARERLLEDRSACVLGTVSSAVGATTVAAVVGLCWLALVLGLRLTGS